MKLAAAVVVLLGVHVAHAGTPPHGARTVTIDYKYISFHANELHYKLEWNTTEYRGDHAQSIDGEAIEALYASLKSLKEFDDDLRCISHTDDYPNITITIEGDSPVVIETDSNCHANVPWNVVRNGKHYAQFTTDIPTAVYKLLAAIDPKRWRGRPDSPEASTDFGGEIVDLGTFSPLRKQASPGAVACAKDLETSAKGKQLFGESPKVRDLSLGCDLATSAECARVTAQAELVWDGLAVRVELPCSKGIIDLSAPIAAQITELRTFIESKPVRTLARLSTRPPRVWSDGEWNAEGQMDDGPLVTFEPGKKTIHVRGISQDGPAAVKYLHELGIDAKQVTKHKGHLSFETELDVDFNGKPVK